VLLGDRGAALEALLAMAEERMAEAGRLVVPETGTDPAQEAFDAAIRAMDGAAARRWLGECGTGRAATALKVRAAGALGDPATVPWLIQRMEQTDHAKAAGEAFALLTGADLDYLDLDGAAPSDAPEGPSDNPSDPRTALDADEDLPWPDPGAVAGWWEEIRATLPTGPLFLGRASTSEAWCVGLAEGYQRQRRAAALHIALADPVAPLPTWRTRCD
jgi:uncharacterized protein (TIGR02270 family)